MIDAGLSTKEECNELEVKLLDEVEKLAENVLEEDLPDNSEFYTDIYKEYTGELRNIRGRDLTEIYTV